MAQKEQKLRVLIVAPSIDILGGQAVQAARLMERLRQEPLLDVGFLPINPRLPFGLHHLQRIKYVRTVVTSIAYVLSLLFRVPRYHVIHIFSASYLSFVLAPTPAILISKLYRRKTLLNYHSGEAADHLHRWRRTAIPTIRLVDSIVVQSEYLMRIFAFYGLKATAIYNLIDTSKFRFRERSPLRPVFLSNRNLESHYGVDRVLRAFAIIQEQIPQASLTVAGDGSQRRNLEALAKDLGLRNTTFTGQVDPENIASVYDAADIFLNGSEIDNQPLSILEAFSCGLPIVTTDAGGIPDIVQDGRTGMVVSRGDYAEMAKRAMALLNDPALANELIQQGRLECQKYSWEAVRDAWFAVYLGLVRHKEAQKGTANRKLRKLTQTSFDELRMRGSQALAAFAERANLSRQSISDDALPSLDDFRARTAPRFFSSFEDPQTTIAELRRRWPSAEKEIVERADRIVAGYFDLLGFRNLSFATPIDWHLEPVANKRAPLMHWSRLNYLDAELFGDKKIVWELNRHQYFITLGQAYWLTGDEKYAQTFAAHMSSWMDQNPPKLGVNWASSLEVAFRSISWLWALHFFKNSSALTTELFARTCKFLYLNARHLETYLSTYFSPNTHLTGEALGLFYLGTLLPEFKESGRWRSTGLQILCEQLERHVEADGVYFEQSSYYHRYTTDFYLHLAILLSASNEAQPAELHDKLRLLLDHLMYITRPDGTTPLFGDDDGGRLMMLSAGAANDFRATLAVGAALLERPDYKFVAAGASQDALWLLGPKGLKSLDSVKAAEPEKQSIAFPVGGYYVMRDGWTPKSNYLLFDCGPHGTDNCGHAHADALSFDLAVNGRTMLVDPGTYTYTASKHMRDWFRGSDAHNTLTIDRKSSSECDGPFSWRTIARPECDAWITHERFDYVLGAHDGYNLLPDPATHKRSILFLKQNYWVLRDQVETSGFHHLEPWFHLDSGVTPLHSKDNAVRMINGNGNSAVLQMAAFAPNVEWREEQRWVSHCYGQMTAAPVFVFTVLAKGSQELVTFLLPEPAGASRPKVRQIEALNGSAFEIENERQHDVLMFRSEFEEFEAGWVETARLGSDFDVTWVRFSEGSRTPDELILINGFSLEFEGRALLRSTKKISYLAARRVGDRFRIDTEEGSLEIVLPVADLEALFADLNEGQETS